MKSDFAILKSLYAAMRGGQSIGLAYNTASRLSGVSRVDIANIYCAWLCARMDKRWPLLNCNTLTGE